MSAIIKAKPQAAKGQYMKSVVDNLTMYPGVKSKPCKNFRIIFGKFLDRRLFIG